MTVLMSFFLVFLEAPPDYHFTKLLPKQQSGPAKEDLTLICTLNNYRAQVAWYRDRTKISENDNRYTIDKDIIGNCKLCINCPTLAESGKYSCKIVGREKEKNCFTKTEVLIKGIFYSLFLNSFWDTHLSFFIYFHYIQFYFFHFL